MFTVVTWNKPERMRSAEVAVAWMTGGRIGIKRLTTGISPATSKDQKIGLLMILYGVVGILIKPSTPSVGGVCFIPTFIAP